MQNVNEHKRTWVKRFKEVLKIKDARGGVSWLEKEALNYRKTQKAGLSIIGAKVLIRANLTYLAQHYFSPKELEHLKRVIGLSYRLFQ